MAHNNKNLPTYIYIDVSNINNACNKSLNFAIDFTKLYSYFQQKYPNLCDVRYYEGIAKNETWKRGYHNYLQREVGYTICKLERRSYQEPDKFGKFNCEKCGYPNRVKIYNGGVKLKSNVDVYLVSDIFKQLMKIRGAARIIIVSCDGDYVEAIKAIISINPEICVNVLATPTVRSGNALSSRLKYLSGQLSSKNYCLLNIDDIKDQIRRKKLR